MKTFTRHLILCREHIAKHVYNVLWVKHHHVGMGSFGIFHTYKPKDFQDDEYSYEFRRNMSLVTYAPSFEFNISLEWVSTHTWPTRLNTCSCWNSYNENLSGQTSVPSGFSPHMDNTSKSVLVSQFNSPMCLTIFIEHEIHLYFDCIDYYEIIFRVEVLVRWGAHSISTFTCTWISFQSRFTVRFFPNLSGMVDST